MAVYDIAITRAEGAAPADGFIDLNKAQYYINASGDYPNTKALGEAKARGNFRYKALLSELAQISPNQVMTVTAPGATADAAPTTLTLRVNFNHTVLRTENELSPGTFLVDAAAVERAAARALIIASTAVLEYFDPTTTAAKGDNAGVTAGRYYGPRFESLAVGPVAASLAAAEALITVTLVP
jgi:hypothetical protein